MLTTPYETFNTKEGETIQKMHTRFTSVTHDLHSLGEDIRPTKQVRKMLNILPKLWQSKVNSITEVRELKTLTMDKLIENLKTYEIRKATGEN